MIIMLLEFGTNRTNFLMLKTRVEVMEQHVSSWEWAPNILRHLVMFVVRKVCDVLKVVTFVVV